MYIDQHIAGSWPALGQVMVRLALVVCCGLAPPAIAQSASSLINPLGFTAYLTRAPTTPPPTIQPARRPVSFKTSRLPGRRRWPTAARSAAPSVSIRRGAERPRKCADRGERSADRPARPIRMVVQWLQRSLFIAGRAIRRVRVCHQRAVDLPERLISGRTRARMPISRPTTSCPAPWRRPTAPRRHRGGGNGITVTAANGTAASAARPWNGCRRHRQHQQYCFAFYLCLECLPKPVSRPLPTQRKPR